MCALITKYILLDFKLLLLCLALDMHHLGQLQSQYVHLVVACCGCHPESTNILVFFFFCIHHTIYIIYTLCYPYIAVSGSGDDEGDHQEIAGSPKGLCCQQPYCPTACSPSNPQAALSPSSSQYGGLLSLQMLPALLLHRPALSAQFCC